MRKPIHLISTVIIIILMQIILPASKQNLSFAIDNKYSNQLLKLSVEKSQADGSGLNVKVYTTKRYPLQLSPIKKDNNEYIIFLPETYHSITSKPDISSCKDLVRDVDVKLIPYIGSNSNNGYTKIIIRTNSDDVKMDISNELSNRDMQLQEELSRMLASKSISLKSLKLRSKKTVTSHKNIAAKPTVTKVAPNNSAAKNINLKSPSKPSALKQVSQLVESKNHTKETKSIISSENKSAETKKPVKPNKVEDAKTSGAQIAIKDIKPVDLTKNKQSDNVRKDISQSLNSTESDNTDTETTSANQDNAQSANQSTDQLSNQTNDPTQTDLNQDSSNVSTNIANSTVPAATVNNVTNTNEKRGFPFKKIFATVIFTGGIFILLLIGLRLLKNRHRKQADTPIRIEPLVEEEEQGVEQSMQDGKMQASFAKAQNNIKKSDDIITRLAQNPIKPVKHSPLKGKGYTEISPDELENEEFYNLKNKTATSPSGSELPEGLECIAGIEVENKKGFYLVQIENEKVLIGVVNSDVFLINKFDRITSPKFNVRKTAKDSAEEKDVYFVQVGNWCGLISSDEKRMRLDTAF